MERAGIWGGQKGGGQKRRGEGLSDKGRHFGRNMKVVESQSRPQLKPRVATA